MYLKSFLFSASKQKLKRDSTSVNTCTDFGTSKESFAFSKTNPLAESSYQLRVTCLLDSFLFGASKQKSKSHLTSIHTHTDFEKSKERFGFDCGCLVFTYLESFYFPQVNKNQSAIRHQLKLVLILKKVERELRIRKD